VSLALAGAIALGTLVASLGLALAVGDRTLARLAHPDAEHLRRSGWRHGLRRWEGLRMASAMLGLLAGSLLGAPLAGAALAALAPSAWVRLRAEAAADHAQRELTSILAATAGSLGSGLALPEALRRAVERSSDPLASAFLSEALRAFELGASLGDALERAAGRTRDARERLALGTLALGIAERLPRERLAELIGSIANRMRYEQELEDEVRARAAGARQQQRILALLVPALAAYLALTMPMLAAVLSGEVGRTFLIPAAAVLEGAGFLIGRRVVRGALA